jgi:hypothetical protein
MEPNRIVLVALGILTLARFILLPCAELDTDEAYVALCGTRPDWHYMECGPLPPLVSRTGIAICGNNEFGHRLFAPLLACVMTLAGGALAAGIASGRASAWAIAGFSVLPAMTTVATRLTAASLTVFFFTMFAWAVWRGLHSHKSSIRFWAFAGIASCCALLCHPGNLVPLILSIGLLTIVPRWRRNLPRYKFLAILLPIAASGMIPYLLWDEHLRLLASLHWRNQVSGVFSLAGPTDLIRRICFAYTPLVTAALVWVLYRDLRYNRNALGARYSIAFSLPLILATFALALLGKTLTVLLLPASLPLLARFALAWPSVPMAHTLKIAMRTTALAFAALFSLLIAQTDLLRRSGITWPYLDAAPRGNGFSYWTSWKKDSTGVNRGWRETAALVDHVRNQISDTYGEQPFLIASSPEIAALLAFYMADEQPTVESMPAPAATLQVSSNDRQHLPVFDINGEGTLSPLLGWKRLDQLPFSAASTHSWDATNLPAGQVSPKTRALYICTPSPRDNDELPPQIEAAFKSAWPTIAATVMRGGEKLRTITIFVCEGFHAKGL